MMDQFERELMDKCSRFGNYSSIEEYVDDIVACLKTFCRYSECEARDFVKTEEDMVKRMYDARCPAYDLAMDYYPICG